MQLSRLMYHNEFKLQLGKHLPLRSLTVFSSKPARHCQIVGMAADVHAAKNI